jgi:hypothetical protein
LSSTPTHFQDKTDFNEVKTEINSVRKEILAKTIETKTEISEKSKEIDGLIGVLGEVKKQAIESDQAIAEDLTEYIDEKAYCAKEYTDEKVEEVKKNIKVIKGEKGDQGVPGVAGASGSDGSNGRDGKDGSPDTPSIIRDKLETLKGKDRLSARAIKDLPVGGGFVAGRWGGIQGAIADQTDLVEYIDNKTDFTVADTDSIDMTLSGQQFKADLKTAYTDDLYVNHGTDGEGTEELDYIDFDLTATSGDKIGRMRWNNTDRCLEYDSHVDGHMVTNQIGQETWIRVRNNTGATIEDGKAVYVTGALGNRPTIALARADADATALTYLGVTTHDIEDNEDGFVTVRGSVRGVNTNDFTAGDILYLSETTAGELTNTRPAAPNWVIAAGICTVKSANGEIGVSDRIVGKLGRLSDVDQTGVIDGKVLSYKDSIWSINDDILVEEIRSTNDLKITAGS